MHRVVTAERPHWREKARELGFTFHSPGGELYWDERAYWVLSLDQVERDLEAPTAELDALCLELVSRAVNDEAMLRRLGLPEACWDVVRGSWLAGSPSLYGRMDLAYDGTGPAKLLEYNADTPTALYEAAVFQWHWLEDMIAAGRLPGDADQFTSIHERLIDRFRTLSGGGVLHLTAVPDHVEDRGTVAYLEDCARQGGFQTAFIALGDIGLTRSGQFVDLKNRPIHRLFKLYPWEWIFAEPAMKGLVASETAFLEPPWKAILSSKGMLAELWQLAPDHPNLLETHYETDRAAARLGGSYARKPLFSREGANVTLVSRGAVVDQDSGPYGAEGHIRQRLATLARAAGNTCVVGSWVIGGEAAGIGLREDVSPITKNTSRFLPHVILG